MPMCVISHHFCAFMEKLQRFPTVSSPNTSNGRCSGFLSSFRRVLQNEPRPDEEEVITFLLLSELLLLLLEAISTFMTDTSAAE